MLFEKRSNRKPVLYPWTKDFIDAFRDSPWTEKRFNFKSDYNDVKVKMTQQESDMLIRAISAIAQIEIEVKTFWAELGKKLPHPEISDLGYVMAYSEVVHNYAYEKLIDVLQLEDKFNENLETKVMKGRVQYLKKHLEKVFDDPKKQYVYSIILFTLLIENVSLFSQFYIISYFNRFENLLKDTSQQVSYTISEETLHAQMGMKIINVMREEYPELFDQELHDMIEPKLQKALNYEFEMIDWILGDFENDKISSSKLKAFITNRMNESFNQIGFDVKFDINYEDLNSTKWFDEEIHGQSAVDFFAKRPTSYSKSAQTASIDDLF